MPYTHVVGHYSRRRHTRYWVRGHNRKIRGSAYGRRSGKPFKKLQGEVAKGYVGKKVPSKWQWKYGKTYSKSEAQEVGRAVAGKQFWSKYGKRKGTTILRRER